MAKRRARGPRSGASQRRAPRQPRQPATAKSMRPTSSRRGRRAMTRNPPLAPTRWTLAKTTGHTKAACAACAEAIPARAWRARTGRLGARVSMHPARLPKALPHGTRQGLDSWREHARPTARHSHAAAGGGPGRQRLGQRGRSDPGAGPPALVAGGHGGPYPATCTGLQAEFAELLQHVAEAALAAASPSGRCHTEQWWELLFLPPRLLLAAPAKETA